MDSARTINVPRPHPHHPPPPPYSHPASAAPPPHPPPQPQPPPHATVDTRPPTVFAPPTQPQPPSGPHPAPHQQQQQQQQYQQPSPYPPPGHGPSLPPIQQHTYPQPGAGVEQNNLPPFRHPTSAQQSPHDGREVAQDYHQQYIQHNRSGHATPAPVNQRSYSHDSHQQGTPTTPALPGQFPAGSAPDGPLTPSLHMEHGAHASFPPANGIPHGLPPSGPPYPSQGAPQSQPPMPTHDPHAPPPYAMTPVVENHASYAMHPHAAPQHMYQSGYGPASSFGGGAGGGSMSNNKRKPMRAQQACEQCRQRKQKCDEGNPCSFCKEQNISCNYRDTPPAKTDKNMEKVLNSLDSVSSRIDTLGSRFDAFDAFDARLNRLEAAAAFSQYNGPTSAPAQHLTLDEQPTGGKQDHRTGPHKLITLWSRVHELFKDLDVRYNESYVMEAEDRGVLRLYGRGEGIDHQDGTQAGGPASPARSDDSVDSAPTPREGIWGRGFVSSNLYTESPRPPAYLEGGLRPDGSLDLDMHTINTLFESYMKHIHVMHPFLDKARIRRLFDTFIHHYSPNSRRMQHHTGAGLGFAVGSNTESDRPLKRQRSNGSAGMTTVSSDSVKNALQTERSPANAIVYLVLALGKVCAHNRPLPGIVPDGKAANVNQAVSHTLAGNPGFTGSSPIAGTIRPSPISPKSTPTTQPTPPDSIMRIESRSRRSSFDGSPINPSVRNIDVIPGIAYYAKAAEILGDQGDGNDLVHAQMFLLAGLYKGQLARVKESMSWLSMAGRACQILLDRYKLYNMNYWKASNDARDVQRNYEAGLRQIKDKRHNLIVLTSWSCLQLESDILAELKLPSSGIQSIEDLLPMPHNLSLDESYDNVQAVEGDQENYNNILVFYTAQMFLRKRLNQVHREMYGQDFQHQPLSAVQAMIKGHEQTIQDWRAGLPELLRWYDDDPPASDILNARLRAKYWGARYVINRPFLDYALHIMPQIRQGQTIEQVAVDSRGHPRDQADILMFKAIEGMGEEAVWAASKRCIDAALQSTVALDSVPQRLVVTNIHGTAHAQFGNMLVLAATYNTLWLKGLVPPQAFQEKLARTITFLRRLAPISPTAKLDCGILEKVQQKLFGPPADAKMAYRNEIEPASVSHSFSSR